MDDRVGTVEDVVVNVAFWRDRSVFITGHTGFKGSWLSIWLQEAGARVHGYALQPPTQPSLFVEGDVQRHLTGHTIADVRDAEALADAVTRAQPSVVFHLAAQPLVRASYEAPIDTYAVNVLGTVHLLDAVRRCPSVRAVVVVTTDKCYENRDWPWGYRENEPLGGHDPYSSSKACAELVTEAYRRSFLQVNGVAVATARAGNVIGGGDWAADRLVPDYFRATDAGRALNVRNPDAVRPWQHVLEPLAGYLRLAEYLVDDGELAGAWNFGPGDADAQPVRWVLDRLCAHAGGAGWQPADGPHPHEAHQLRLDSSKAAALLGWRPRWTLEHAVERTAAWHQSWRSGRGARALCEAQVADYCALTA